MPHLIKFNLGFDEANCENYFNRLHKGRLILTQPITRSLVFSSEYQVLRPSLDSKYLIPDTYKLTPLFQGIKSS